MTSPTTEFWDNLMIGKKAMSGAERQARYRAANVDKIRTYQKEWKATHKNVVRAHNLKWKAAHVEETKAYFRNYIKLWRARKSATNPPEKKP